MTNPKFKEYLLTTSEASNGKEVETIQTLWSGYGKISRYKLENSSYDSVVVKKISLNQMEKHPRGWNTQNSHNRKIKSYAIETLWYEQWNQRTNPNCKTAKFLGSFSEGKDLWIIMEDLRLHYPRIKSYLEFSEVKVCLKWLANFHAVFMNEKPTGLWEKGTYWHLETRPDELDKINDPEIKLNASAIDKVLSNCRYQTILHGDAKLANFCFSEESDIVAAVDFQYVGGGCGMKDVAYFLGSCLSSEQCLRHDQEFLDYYFKELQIAIKSKEVSVEFEKLRNEWDKMYAFACADFTRFMLGWMPSHQKINPYNLDKMQAVLTDLNKDDY